MAETIEKSRDWLIDARVALSKMWMPSSATMNEKRSKTKSHRLVVIVRLYWKFLTIYENECVYREEIAIKLQNMKLNKFSMVGIIAWINRRWFLCLFWRKIPDTEEKYRKSIHFID